MAAVKIDSAYLRMMYEYLHTTVMVPLKIDVPCEWLIQFNITKCTETYGWANPENYDDGFQEYVIDISKVKNTTYKDIQETLLHEMIHIALHNKGDKDWDEHGSRFQLLKEKIETFTGFDIS